MSKRKTFPEGKPKTTETVRIPAAMLKAIEGFLETEIAKKMGYRFKTDVVTAAVRDFLKEHEYYVETPPFEHYNTYRDHITIRDRRNGRFIDVYIKPEGIAWCETCDKTACPHIEYALNVPEVIKALEKRGWERRE